MAPGKKKVCARLVHNGTERVPCGNTYTEGACPKPNHVWKMKTGYCNNKQCEGTKPRGYQGAPLPTCKSFTTCGCDCHAMLDMMFKMAEQPRILVENSEYIPDRGDFVIPDFDLPRGVLPDTPTTAGIDPLFSPLGGVGTADIERPGYPTQDGATGRTWTATPTGRKARGQLEYEVLAVCRDWVNGVYEEDIDCTPRFVAEQIGKRNAAEAPSTGAIQAVWKRWERLEFCDPLLYKPVRFIGFQVDPSEEKLERMKGQAKRTQKREKSAARRGMR